MSNKQTNGVAKARYELRVDHVSAIVARAREREVSVLAHISVLTPFEAQGLGLLLVGALADVGKWAPTAIDACSFVADYLNRRPADQDAIA